MHVLCATALVAFWAAVIGAPTATAAKPLRSYGDAKVVSVDGPALVTVKAAKRELRLRLFGIDTPQAGECGSAESVAALKALVRGKRSRVSYELVNRVGRVERDTAGRYLAQLSSTSSSPSWRPIGDALINTGWAQRGVALAASQGPPSHGDLLTSVGAVEPHGARAAAGVWASCGGRLHLPLGQPVPAHAPVPWNVNADGQLLAIGPITFPSTLTPEATLTVPKVAALAPVELSDLGDGSCWVRVPSLELVLTAASISAQHPCGTADISAVVSAGPGAASLTNGLRAGSTSAQAKALFPLLEPPYDADDDLLFSGEGRSWAWRTGAWVDGGDGSIGGFRASLSGGDRQ